jgi:hypothetical protein
MLSIDFLGFLYLLLLLVLNPIITEWMKNNLLHHLFAVDNIDSSG